jgi:hypothetical protein
VIASTRGAYPKRKRRQGSRRWHASWAPVLTEDVQGCIDLPFALLQRGDGRGTESVLWGTWQGVELREFDYWYWEESTDSKGRSSKTTYRFSCAVAEIDAACSPLTLGRENVFTRLADSLGLADIEIELDELKPEFTVKCKDASSRTASSTSG